MLFLFIHFCKIIILFYFSSLLRMQKNTIKEMQKIKQERREFKVSQLVEKIEKEGWEELHFPALKITERESRASLVEDEENNVEYDV